MHERYIIYETLDHTKLTDESLEDWYSDKKGAASGGREATQKVKDISEERSLFVRTEFLSTDI